MNFVRTKNLGFDRDNIVYFEREGKLLQNHDVFLSEIRKLSGVEKAAASGFMIGGANSTGGVHWEGKQDEDQIQFWETDAGYGLLKVLGIELVAGRDFDPSFAADSTSIIFNETAIAAMGLEDPIGKTIRHYSGRKKIIGVVKNFNLISLHTKVEPALFLFEPDETHFIIAKIESRKELKTVERIEALYKEFNPNCTFNVNFLAQDYQALKQGAITPMSTRKAIKVDTSRFEQAKWDSPPVSPNHIQKRWANWEMPPTIFLPHPHRPTRSRWVEQANLFPSLLY